MIYKKIFEGFTTVRASSKERAIEKAVEVWIRGEVESMPYESDMYDEIDVEEEEKE